MGTIQKSKDNLRFNTDFKITEEIGKAIARFNDVMETVADSAAPDDKP
jgi:hypothetical protein